MADPFSVLPEEDEDQDNLVTTPTVNLDPFSVGVVNTDTDPLGDPNADPQSDSLPSQTQNLPTEQPLVQDQPVVQEQPVLTEEQLNEKRIKTILDQPGPTAEKAELFDIQNPSVTNVEQGKSGQFFRTDVPGIGCK